MADDTSGQVTQIFNPGTPASDPAPDPAPEPAAGSGTPDPNRPEWVPEPFWDGEKKAVRAEDMAKSWRDTKADHTRLSQEIAELKKGAPQVPEAPDVYWAELDAEALKAAAPNSVHAAGGADGETVKSFMRSAHAHGVPPETARAMLTDYFKGVNPHLPAQQSAAERMQAAIRHQGPNGQAIANDTQAWLEQKAKGGAFTGESIGVLQQLVQSGPGLSMLYNLMRTSQSSGPPSAAGASIAVDRATEERKLKEMLADPVARKTKMAEIEARYNALHGPAHDELGAGRAA